MSALDRGWARLARLGGRTRGRPLASGELPPAPTFLIIGAQKGGTRWLRFNLARHPDVFCAEQELEFFNSPRYGRGIDWYRAQFAGWAGERAIGESSPGYSMPAQRARRTANKISRELPSVRLLAVLRDPVERTLSAFIHHVDRGRIEPGTDLLGYLRAHPPAQDRLRLVAGGLYAENLAPYFKRFGSRLLVTLNDDVRTSPGEVYRRALEHVGVDADFAPEDLDRVRFSNPTPRPSPYAAERPGERRRLDEEERSALLPYFAADIERLEERLGRDLSAWRR